MKKSSYTRDSSRPTRAPRASSGSSRVSSTRADNWPPATSTPDKGATDSDISFNLNININTSTSRWSHRSTSIE